ALDALAESRVKEVHVLGRRGPVQAKFTTNELRELRAIVDCATLVDPAELVLNAESEAELAHRSNVNGPGNMSLFRAFASRKAELTRTHHLVSVSFEPGGSRRRRPRQKDHFDTQPSGRSAVRTSCTANRRADRIPLRARLPKYRLSRSSHSRAAVRRVS